MFKLTRKILIHKLWDSYISAIPAYNTFFAANQPVLDHFAIIDLPSQHTGMNYLARIFSTIGFTKRGSGYLPDKQNDFLWMVQEDYNGKLPHEVLPQIVLADFRWEELSSNTQRIVEKYLRNTTPFDYKTFEYYSSKLQGGEVSISHKIAEHIFDYLVTRQWPLPNISDYRQVSEENELIAWALVFGRRVNHFGIAVHLLGQYSDLDEFNHKITEAGFGTLNTIGGIIKGGKYCNISQSSIIGKTITIPLSDDNISIADSFMEFVWRYPIENKPILWTDYYTGFVPHNANHVIESIYTINQNH